MKDSKKDIIQVFEQLNGYFSPKIIAEVNDVYIKIAKIKGDDLPWHTHLDEDEFFFVLQGSLTMELKGQIAFQLKQNEFYVVPKGIEHRVYSENESWIMLIEKKSTKHTGEVKSDLTKTIEEQR